MNLLKNSPNREIKIIAIGSGKGGVGKSSLTVMLAQIFRRMSLRVGVIDADLYGPSLSLMLPPEKPLTLTGSGRIIPAESRGIKIVSLSHFTQGKEALIVRAPIANATIKKFLEHVDWGEIDVVLIDLPPGTGDIQLTLMQTIPLTGAVVVTTPSKVALIDVKKSIEMFQHMEIPILGLVENMSYYRDRLTNMKLYPFGEGGGKTLAENTRIPYLGGVPLDEEICEALDQGFSIFEGAKKREACAIVEEIGIEIRSKICKDRTGLKKIINIFPGDHESFVIASSEGKFSLRYAEVQKSCPCAHCQGMGKVEKNVSAKQLGKVGNYAIYLQFTSGCSQGIYTWDHLERHVLLLPV